MHRSLNPERARSLATPLPRPVVDIFDIHMHSGAPEATRGYVKAARVYGVTQACNLALDDVIDAMEEEFGDFFYPCGWPPINRSCRYGDFDWHRFEKEWIEGFGSKVESGMRCIKLKSGPEKHGRPEIMLDDPRLAPFFEQCVRYRIPVQAHIAQPDRWWSRFYDEGTHGPKRFYLDQLEPVLSRHPDLPYIGVHMGCNPEDLNYLSRMMASYPNYHIDTSATKWVVRELSAQSESARAFFLSHAERICFGSDLIVQDQIEDDYYTSRFHVQRRMWETDVRSKSMINDPDALEEGPFLNGLALPEEVLKRLYRENAERLLMQRHVRRGEKGIDTL